MTKHTRGPWKVNNPTIENINGQEFKRFYVHTEGNELCLFKALHATEQDAHLIAAAPELLEALDVLLRNIKGFNNQAKIDLFLNNCDQLVKKAEAALNKAKGG